MSITVFFVSLGRLWLWGFMLICLLTSRALAQDVSITALFKPDSAYPHLNQFKNTTPSSGYCAQYPAQCVENQTFSLRVPIRFESNRPIPANHTSPRQGATLKVPAQWRELTVRHVSGHLEKVKVRITGVGSKYVTEDVTKLVGGAADYRAAHNLLWGTSWVNSSPPCLYSGVGYFTSNSYGFFWKTPVQAACVKQAKFDIPWLRYDHLDVAYELETPNPLGMTGGQYVGSLNYTIGPNGDFDFGDVMMPSSSALTMNFTLDVQHTLKVEIPPGGEKVQLIPEGGWQSWLQAGRKPVRLYRDQMFNISASSRFKMYLRCSLTNGRVCMLSDERQGVLVPIKVSVSLPGGLTDGLGNPVRRRELLTQTGAVNFQPGQYVDRQPGMLHFEIERFDYLLAPGLPRRYFGNVTVVWDSEV